jgi:hypothetical protein
MKILSIILGMLFLASCGTKPLEMPGHQGPSNALIFDDENIEVNLTGYTNQPSMTSRCWLHVQLKNKSNNIQRYSLRFIILGEHGDTLKEDVVNFPSVLPYKIFESVHYTYTDWTCKKIWSIKVVR